ncbi:Zinc finger protein [Bacillus cereus ATCC 14579]|uniref:Zinc finger protein n=1 Tax=Bacillus cereus (strain ATCC 14579 / DSM 31 / CCUG 7414 / JCM 2152 / NBRC 15305 / NCIMB 9373 / NCTC 2599 / NRRL B-3711) TaxID=226900 RepID=Q815M8_BACCR|nr:Zinc finger protein [Bacillus cereus ATCC 14579]
MATQHSISTGDLIAKIITPMLNKLYLVNQATKGGEGIYKSSNGLNGVSNLAQDFITTLEKLTCRKDLKVTTLLNWSHVLPVRGLLKKQRAWCPSCYEEDLSNQGTTYERLIWNFELVNFCTKHNCYLSSRCPFCNKTNSILTRKSIPGYCSICEKWLGLVKKDYDLLPVDENYVFVGIIEELVSQSNIYRAEKDNLHMNNAIIHYINECFEGEGSRMATELNIPLSTLITWRSGKSLPEIKSLLRICAFLGINITEFLNNERVDYKARSMKNSGIKINDNKERKRHNH